MSSRGHNCGEYTPAIGTRRRGWIRPGSRATPLAMPNPAFGNIFVILFRSEETAMKLSALGFGILMLAGSIVATAQERYLDTTSQALKQAVEKKDADAVKKLAAETHEAASADTSDHAKEVDLYTEYALYATAVQAPPATTVDLLAALEEQNPKSKYFDLGYSRYFMALNQTGAAAKIPGVAEKALASVPDNTDVLMVLTQAAMAKNQTDKALGLGKRLVAATGKRQK